MDWTREAHTLDEARNRAVVDDVHARMHEDGLIYRGARIVNWDPKMQTTVSDEEIEWIEEKAPLYHLQYGPFEIATARPETKFGDKVRPSCTRTIRATRRYADRQTFETEWINGPVTAAPHQDPHRHDVRHGPR